MEKEQREERKNLGRGEKGRKGGKKDKETESKVQDRRGELGAFLLLRD